MEIILRYDKVGFKLLSTIGDMILKMKFKSIVDCVIARGSHSKYVI